MLSCKPISPRLEIRCVHQSEIMPWIYTLSAQAFTARRSYASAVFAIVIPSLILYVRMSVTRVHCDETKEHTADILNFYKHERVITSFLIPVEFGGRCPLPIPPEICA